MTGINPTFAPRELRASVTAYSSVVGSSVMLVDSNGAVVALLMISIPNSTLDYKGHALPIADRIVDLWNTRANDPASFEAGEQSMRMRAAETALRVGEAFRTRNQAAYAEGYDDGTSCAASAIRALPTGEK